MNDVKILKPDKEGVLREVKIIKGMPSYGEILRLQPCIESISVKRTHRVGRRRYR